MALTSRYVKYVRSEIKMRPVLPFGLPVAVGVVGVLEKDRFVRQGTVETILGHPVGETTDSTRAVEWSGVSGRSATVDFLAEGQASKLFPQAPSIGARVEAKFASTGAFLLSVPEVTVTTLNDPFSLLQAMVRGYQQGVWRKDYVLVTETAQPTSMLALIAKQSDTKVLLSAKASVTPAKLADLAGQASVTNQTNDVLRFEGGGSAMFFNGHRVKESFWTQLDSAVPFDEAVSPADAFDAV